MAWLDEERLAVIGDIARALFTMAVDLGGRVTGESSYRLSGITGLGFWRGHGDNVAELCLVYIRRYKGCIMVV